MKHGYYPQAYSLRRFFLGAHEHDLDRLHHGLKRGGYIGNILECMLYTPVPVNPIRTNGHRVVLYPQDGK